MEATKLFIAAALVSMVGLGACANLPSVNNPPIVSPFQSERIKVTSMGQGDDIVLIPGLGSGTAVWDTVKDELAKTHRVHIVHVAGFAGLELKSEDEIFNNTEKAISDYVKTNNLKNVTIIGHSMGGELAMAINARNEGMVKMVLVVDAFTFYSLLYNPMATPENTAPQAAGLRAMFKVMPEDKYKEQQTGTIAKLVKAQDKRDLVLDWSMKSNRHAIAQGLYDLMTIDLRPELKNNKAKIHLLYAYDPAMGLPQAVVDGLYQNAYKDVPNATNERIDNSFHFIMYDQPEVFKAKVLEFVKAK